MSDLEEKMSSASDESSSETVHSEKDEDSEQSDESDNQHECEIDEQMEEVLSNPFIPRAKTKHTPATMKFSNIDNVLCIGTAGGDVESFRCNGIRASRRRIYECFVDSSCWSLDFSHDSQQVFCLSSSEGFASVNLETAAMNFASFQDVGELHTLKTIDERTICVGDCSGHIYLCDIRQCRPDKNLKPIQVLNDEVGEYISCLLATNSNHVIAGSGAGVVSVFDLRSSKLVSKNSDSRADILSLTQLGDKPIIAASSLTSEIIIFPWNDNENTSIYDIVPIGGSCNEIRALNESTILTVWDDGILRVNSLFPHQEKGILGTQDPSAEFADVNYNKTLAASIGIDKVVHLWDVKQVEKPNENFFDNL